MKLKLLFLLFIIGIGSALYFYLAYIRIYNIIGNTNLPSPFNTNSFTIGNTNNEGKVKYVALGDSLSAGVGAHTVEETIVYAVAENLAKKYWQVNVVNLAWPGDESIDVLVNQLPQAIAQKPDFVTLFIGVNDVHEKRTFNQFRDNYQQILTQLLEKTNAKIIVINISLLGSNDLLRFPFNHMFNMRTQQFNSIIGALAQNDRIKVIDLYNGSKKTLNASEDYYAEDKFHPSAKGYLLWSSIINAD